MKGFRSGRCESDSGLFTMSTVPSVITQSIKLCQPQILPKLRRSNSSNSRECHNGPVMAFAQQHAHSKLS